MQLITLARAQKSPRLAALSGTDDIELASDWLNRHYVLGPYETDGVGIEIAVEAVVQEACVRVILHLLDSEKLVALFQSETLGSFKTDKGRVAPGFPPYMREFEDVFLLMWGFQRLPIPKAPYIGK